MYKRDYIVNVIPEENIIELRDMRYESYQFGYCELHADPE